MFRDEGYGVEEAGDYSEEEEGEEGEEAEEPEEDEDEDEGSLDGGSGPALFALPESSADVTVAVNPAAALGLSVSVEGWIETCEPGSQAWVGGARRGLRVVRVDSRWEWSLVASLRELKASLALSRGRGDPEVHLVCSGALAGELKWQGGVAGLDGRVYGIPANACDVLVVDPREGLASTWGLLPCSADPLVGDVDDRWCGGVLDPKSGKIIGVPFNATQYLEIDPLKRTVAPRGPPLLFGRHKWRGAALCVRGRVHCVPAEAPCVLRINPNTGECTTFGDLAGAGDGAKWNGGCFSDYDDRIYGVPFDADSVLAIDPEFQTTSLMFQGQLPGGDGNGGPPSSNPSRNVRGKWSGGAIGKDGCMHCAPYNAPCVLKVDLRAHKVEALGHFPGHGKWVGAVAARDGATVWCVPHKAARWLRVDVDRQTAQLVGPKVHPGAGAGRGECKYRGGALGVDGDIYAVPADATTVLRLNVSKGPSQ